MSVPTNLPRTWPESEVTETLSWVTDILTSRNGAEQRIQARPSLRRYFKVRYLPRDERQAQMLDNQVMSLRVGTWLLPYYHEHAVATAIPAPGAGGVDVDTSHMTLLAGDAVLLWQDDETMEVLEAAAVGSDAITFSGSVATTFASAPPLRVCPVHDARLATEPQKQRRAGREDEFTQLHFLVLEQRDLSETHGLDTYTADALAVFADPAVVGSGAQAVTYTKIVNELDFETGQVWVSSPTTFTAQRHEMSALYMDRDAAFAFVRFMAYCRGRAQPFFMPIFDQHMQLAGNIGSTDTAIAVEDALHRLLDGQDTRQHVYLETADGSRYFRKVTGVSGGGATETLTLETPLGVAVSAADVRTFCWLGRFRLDADEVDLAWATAPRLRCRVMAREVET